MHQAVAGLVGGLPQIIEGIHIEVVDQRNAAQRRADDQQISPLCRHGQHHVFLHGSSAPFRFPDLL